WHESVAAGKKPLMMIMRNAERNAQWRHTLQSGIETARVPLDELTPHAEKLAPLLAQWHQKGLSRDASTCLRLTNEGRFWASNILQSLNELIQVLNAPAIALEKP
ncbi:coproporphyrinogen III oxidase, partial [Escherichia coli HM605]